MTRALAPVLAVSLLACGRVPEWQLRDEQSRARRYRDAYETAMAENQELRNRLAAAEQKAHECPDGGPSPQAPSPPK